MAKVIHFHVPPDKAGVSASDGQVSGGYPQGIPPEIAQAMGFRPGEGAGQRYVVLCQPKITLDGVHGASGEPWAVTCLDCIGKDYWKEQIASRPHPKSGATVKTIDGCKEC